MTLRKPALLGPNGLPIRVRDRHAPSPNVRARMGGWLEWRLIDRKGRAVKGGEQHNLIVDDGLDAIPIAPGTYSGGVATAGSLNSFLSHFAVGTGTTPPTESSSALDNELARTTTLVTTDNSRPSAGVYTRTVVREFGFASANGNLTEWAVCRASSGSLFAAELFRDGGGTPITITKTSDYLLRMSYTLEVELAPVVFTPASFTIAGIGLINGNYLFMRGQADSDADIRAFTAIAKGVNAGTSTGFMSRIVSSAEAATGYTQGLGRWTNSGDTNNVSYDAYTPGSYERKMTSASWGVTTANHEWRSFGYAADVSSGGGRASNQLGLVFAIDESDWFTKDNEHILTLNNPLSVSWGRA